MKSKQPTKTIVQCDFDGTVTEEDVSFLMLDACADGDWRALHRQYEEAKYPSGVSIRPPSPWSRLIEKACCKPLLARSR
ncbi:MAG: hypothetical protein MUO99_01535 [Dehalococcoidales bacterium]|nr:hypothetical protein [Dehalococcoidales bacterium]